MTTISYSVEKRCVSEQVKYSKHPAKTTNNPSLLLTHIKFKKMDNNWY